MMYSLKRKCLSAIIGMLLVLIPVEFAGAEATDPSFYNTLYAEDFEDGNHSFNFTNASAKSTNVILTDCTTTENLEYGLGEYSLTIANSEDDYIIRTLINDAKPTKPISMINTVHSENTETYGYSLELSFDWNPADDGGAPRTLFSVIGNKASNPTVFEDKPIMSIAYTGGNRETSERKLEIYRNNRTALIDEIDLTEFLEDEIWDETHIYRVRIVFNTYPAAKEVDGTKFAGSYTIYMDGVRLGTYDYLRNKDRDYVTGLYFESNKKDDNVIDNIMLIEYWNSLKSGEVYKNDDVMVSEIRKAERKVEKLSDSDKIIAADAIEAAKSIHASELSTQEQLDDAVYTLKTTIDALNENDTEDKPTEESFKYIVYNDFEDESDIPFSGEVLTVLDDSQIMNKVWKLDGDASLVSECFEGVNIITDTGERKLDSVLEFDVKFENMDSEGSFVLTQWDDRYRESVKQPINKLTFSSKGVLRENGSSTDTEELRISGVDFSDGKWHRIKIVNHSWYAKDDAVYRMSLYVDGECEYPYSRRKSYSKGKCDAFSQIEFAGLADGAEIFIDNIKVYSTEASTENPPADTGKLMRVVWDIEDLISSAVIGEEEGMYNSKDIAELEAEYDNAVVTVPQITNQSDADEKFTSLTELLNKIRPIGNDIFADGIKYSASDLRTTDSLSVFATVTTTRNAPENNEFLMVTALYKNSDEYAEGELLEVLSDSVTLAPYESTGLQIEVDLNKYSEEERAEMFAKTYILMGEDRYSILKTENNILGVAEENNLFVEEMYGEAADVFKKISATGRVRFLISMKSEKNDDIIVYASNNGGLESVDENASDKFVYFNVLNSGEDGEIVCEFTPESEGEYNLTAYSVSLGKEILSRKIVYKNSEEIKKVLKGLENGTEKISTYKSLLDLDTEGFDKADKCGIDMDSIAEFVLEDTSDIYEFKTKYIKNMNLLYDIKNAGNTDEVLEALDKYEMQPEGVSQYNLRQIGIQVYKNKESVISLEELEKLLVYKPDIQNSSSSNGSSSGGRTGGGNKGVINTAEQNIGNNVKTPYEQARGIFSDIDKYEWANEAINFMAQKDVINGKSEGIFAPGDSITREEFSKIIVSMFSIPAGAKKVEFTDVYENAWYYPYVTAAYNSGIVNGIGEQRFGTGESITRQDACVMLYRTGEVINTEYSENAEFIPFDDDCADYAKEAVEALAKSGIVNGVGNNVFMAEKSLTRAEAAKMIYEFYCFSNQ